jgi:hypothetical protein
VRPTPLQEDLIVFTPTELRARSRQANAGFRSMKEAEVAAKIDADFQRALELFEKNAGDASLKGAAEAIAYEHESQASAFAELPEETRELFARLERHFKALGFTTRVYGPYIGGFSKPYNGFDLIVGW